jgi:hypothetical protein
LREILNKLLQNFHLSLLLPNVMVFPVLSGLFQQFIDKSVLVFINGVALAGLKGGFQLKGADGLVAN